MNNKTSSVLFIFLITMLLVVTISARAPLDADMWWHIRSGEMTLKNGAPLLTDPFSFTRYGSDWTNHSWLSQVILFQVFNLGGFTGLAVYTALLAVISMGLVYRLVKGPPLLKAFLIILCSAACALVWTPRPQMFSLVFFAGLYSLLAGYKHEKRGPLWLIPIFFALWSNLHGGFPIGLALLAVFIAAEAANRIFLYPANDCLSWREISKLALWSITAIPAVLLNPNGIKTWLIPFQTVGITALQNLIQEWASPDFHNLSQQVILWLLVLLVISFSMAGKRMMMGDFLIPLAFAYMTFLARRNISAFAMAAVPAISRGLQAAWGIWQERIEAEGGLTTLLMKYHISTPKFENRNIDQAISRLINMVMIGFLAALAFGRLGIMSLNPIIDRYLQNDYPVQAVNWIRDNHISGNLFNEYNWGGYLIFACPQNLVFLDGRTDLFGDEIIGEWQKVILGDPEWRTILDKWDVQTVLLQPDKPVISIMKDHGWRIGFEDEKSVVMLRE
ncbi:MAG: hypothetical protein AB9891_20215 [Anaerolineaceae bacterium]